jgi:hypothetical protein
MIAADRASPLTPFRNGWISFGLPGVRPCDATYCVVTSELPPTPPVRYHGELGWLPPLPPDLDARMEPYRQRTGTAAMLPWLVDQTRRAGFELPAAFLRLMGSERLQHRIPSCTACFFELFERLPGQPSAAQARPATPTTGRPAATKITTYGWSTRQPLRPLPLAVKQLPHVSGGRAVRLADPMHVAARHLKAAVAHPLTDRRGRRHGAELRGHEVMKPVQRVAVPELLWPARRTGVSSCPPATVAGQPHPR